MQGLPHLSSSPQGPEIGKGGKVQGLGVPEQGHAALQACLRGLC